MATVRVPKTEYECLRRQAAAYRAFAARLFRSVLEDPIEDVVEDFRKTKLYAEAFLKDLESGLRKSSYAKRHGVQAAEKRS